MKYKIGDTVWIKNDLISNKGDLYGIRIYSVHGREKDIRGKQVTITNIIEDNSYMCKEYKYFTDKMIDKDKTNSLGESTYEIY